MNILKNQVKMYSFIDKYCALWYVKTYKEVMFVFPFYQDYYRQSNFFSIRVGGLLNFPLHLHAEMEAIYVTQGTMKIFINSDEYLLSAGDLALVPGNCIHGYENENQGSGFIMLIFSAGYIPSAMHMMKKKYFSFPVISKDILPLEIPYLFNRLLTCGEEDLLIKKGLLYQFIGEILRVNPLVEDVYVKQDDLITRSIKVVYEHYKENVSLESMAALLNTNPCYLSRLFNRSINCGITEYANRLRIEDAKNMLKQTNDTVLSIAMDCGFESIRTFNRVFKNFTGVTPKVYRDGK